MKLGQLKIVTMFVTAVLACTILVRADGAAIGVKAGHLEVQNDVVDAGEVVRGTNANGTFLLRNTGSDPIKVLGAKPACGCTIASFDEEIAPGQTGKVTASVKTDNFRGPIEKSVTVTTNDPQNPTVVLKIKASVIVK